MQQKYAKYVEICRNMLKNMQKYAKNMDSTCKNMPKKTMKKICTKICKMCRTPNLCTICTC